MSFLVFVSRKEEMIHYRERYPDVHWRFVSFHAIDREVFVIDRTDREKSFAVIKRSHQARLFTGVLNVREKYVRTAAALSEYLGLPPGIKDPDCVRDKWKQRLILASQATPLPVYLIRNQTDLKDIPSSFFPCVLKPRFGFNSRSVTLVKNASLLEKQYMRHWRYYHHMKNEDETNGDFIVEEYYGGTEHTVEAFIRDGKVAFSILSDKESMTESYFIETGDFMPSRLPAEAQAAIRLAAGKAVEALGIIFGWCHIEVKWDGRKAVVIEVAARMGGGYFGEMIESAYGIDRVRVLMDALSGKPLRFPATPRNVVKGHRIVATGLTLVFRIGDIEREMTRVPSFKLVWPETPAAIKKVIAGPPFGFKNTLFEYFISHTDPNEAQKIFDDSLSRLTPVQWRMPDFPAGIIWNMVIWFNRCRGKRVLDV